MNTISDFSDSPLVNKDALLTTQQLILYAELVEKHSSDLIKELLVLIEKNKDYFGKNPVREATRDRANYATVCGDRSGAILPAWKLYWDCARSAVAIQFGGLAKETAESNKEIFEAIVLEGKELEDYIFEHVPPINLTVQRECAEIPIAWLYLKLVLLDAFVNRNPPASSAIIYQFLKKIVKYTRCRNCRDILPWEVNDGERMIIHWRHRSMIRLHSRIKTDFERRKQGDRPLSRTKQKAKEKTLKKRQIESAEAFKELRSLLTRGNESASAFLIAIIMRYMVGRYLNGGYVHNTEWEATLNEGIKFVLSRQSDMSEADWPEIKEQRDPKDPWVHKYLPLLHVLDLNDEVLLPHLDQLVKASKHALTAVEKKLKYYRGSSCSLRDKMARDREIYEVLVAGLSLGQVVYDRLKDLLSNRILNSLGARTPETDLTFKQALHTGLRFRDNMDKGVLQLWKHMKANRPGAILVFGPPGTGKSTIATVLAKQLNTHSERSIKWRFLEITPADFTRHGNDRIVACAESIFNQLRHVRRCVVLLDEMEEFLQARTLESGKESRLITTAFLPLLQDVVNRREIILVVATNFVGNIDPAITRRGRFDLILPLGPPDVMARQRHIAKFFNENPIRSSENKTLTKAKEKEVIKILIKYTMGYAYSEMENYYREYRSLVSGRKMEKWELRIAAWRLRAEKIPTALTGRAGCSWRTFSDEATRFARYAEEVQPFIGASEAENMEYWLEPELPLVSERKPPLPKKISGVRKGR